MVLLSTDFVCEQLAGEALRCGRFATRQQFLRSKTHLQLYNKRIDEIGDLSACEELAVLYLHNNRLSRLCNLHTARHLTRLYLTHNRIQRIENLAGLMQLRKLYLGHNEVAVLEGLEELPALEELHLENQRLPPGESLHCDPRCVDSLAGRLRLLDVSGDGLRTLQPLRPLARLEDLRATANRLADSRDAEAAVVGWRLLRRLDLRRNPLAADWRLRERLIGAAGPYLESLDGRDVSEASRQFLQRMRAHRSLAPPPRQGADMAEPALVALAPSLGELVARMPPVVRRTVSQTLLRDAGPTMPPKVAPVVATKASVSAPAIAAFPAWPVRDEKPSKQVKASTRSVCKTASQPALNTSHEVGLAALHASKLKLQSVSLVSQLSTSSSD